MAYNYEYPYTDASNVNDDWFLNKMGEVLKEMSALNLKWESVEQAWEETKQFITDYFDNLDVSTEINNKLDAMAKDGTLSSLLAPFIANSLPPYVVGSVSEMTDIHRNYVLSSNSHLYQYNGSTWVDTGITYGGGIGNVITYIGEAENNVDLNDFSGNTIYFLSTGHTHAHSPINSGMVYTYGDSALRGQMAIDFTTGESYWRRFTTGGGWTNFDLQALTYVGDVGSSTDLNTLREGSISYVYPGTGLNYPPITNQGMVIFTIGDSGLKYQIAFGFNTGVRYTRRYTSNSDWGSWTSGTSSDLQYIGQQENEINLDTEIPYMTVSFLATPNTALNNPAPEGTPVYIFHYGDSASSVMIVRDFNTGKEWWRRRTHGSGWLSWHMPNELISNENAKMVAFDNSIITGTVWKDEHFDHFTSYQNSPYAILAQAINIREHNVVNHYYGGTGLVYDNGEGSFLENIKSVGITDEDVLLTHFWTHDMQTPIGSIESTAGDGTLAGAVLELVNFMKSQNGLTELILLSIPPADVAPHAGENVFNVPYENGSTVGELDVLMHQLANKYKFTYIDFSEWKVSYYYQDYVDGNNVHANTDALYRQLGAYIGGRASEQINY